ncbi:general transcription factor IIH subunit 4-like [Protobothrops mucrosquamatus]|uniref:general transcription factor IIH subunit 4-like n=1 Tax=Protobothrops mucrosquamatus TaxID=103944 RepID=UPI000775E3E0|nr:general transcription factor IIH subunit 4-like [Protobothrops mucrosquamatus]
MQLTQEKGPTPRGGVCRSLPARREGRLAWSCSRGSSPRPRPAPVEDSELQIALIALFSEMLYRFPNLVVAQVTRESTQQAIANGITADQIIHFLRTRAHAVMLKQTPVLPPTITDQIRLWELERDRLRFSEGVLYNQFLSQVDFELLRNHAKELGVLVFENPAKRLMVVTPAGHSDVKRFWKRQKHSS